MVLLVVHSVNKMGMLLVNFFGTNKILLNLIVSFLNVRFELV